MKRHLIILFIFACLLVLVTPAGAGLPAQETELNQAGLAYELNQDSQGMLWVSEFLEGEIWRVDPVTGDYTIYPVSGQPSDARGDGAGHAWWADYDSNHLGRLTLGDNHVDVDIWEITGSLGLYTTAIDSEGDIWVTDTYMAILYELDPDQAENNLCIYTLPDNGMGGYMTVSGQSLWLVDTSNGRLLRLDTIDDGSHTFTWWQPVEYASLQGIAVDSRGQVWLADVSNGVVGRLDPDPSAPIYTTYAPPTEQIPQMLASNGSLVWVSLQGPGGVGVLNPAVAAGQDQAVTSGSEPVTPTCSTLAATIHATLNPTPAPVDASWADQVYPTAVTQDGWGIYDSPEGAAPYGIASASEVWVVDQGRQMLARLKYGGNIYLPIVFRP
jgi:streptogramin lyase